MNTNIGVPISEMKKFVVPLSFAIHMFAFGLSWDEPEKIWEQFGEVENQTLDGLIEWLTNEVSNSGNTTISGAAHTLIPFNKFCSEFAWATRLDFYDGDHLCQPIDRTIVYVDLEN